MAEHPDKGGDSEKFSKINDAFQVLSDPNKRNRYDLLINVVKVDTSDVSEYKAKNMKVDFNIKQGLGSVSVKKV
jgi:curved DNA-binding protein CbpA